MQESGHLDAVASALFVFSLAGIVAVIALISAVRALVASIQARSAEASVDPAAPLRAGAAVVTGKVVLEDAEEPAVRIAIEQQGTESKTSKGTTHVWSETTRRVRARS